jgi:dipeptidyl aminopeptidase/acylaminoacyl peptidase
VIYELLQTKSALLADVERNPGTTGAGGPERLLVRSDLTGTMQLYELSEGQDLVPLTDLPEPVNTARYVVGRRQAVLQVDHGGDERHQLYLVDLDQAAASPVTDLDLLIGLTDDPKHVYQLAGVAPDGGALAYLSTRRNDVDFDLWTYDLASGERRCLFDDGGYCMPGTGFSPDGRWVSILRPGPRPLDMDLLLVGVETGEVRVIMAHPDEAAVVAAPAWAGANTFYFSSNVGSDRARLLHHDLTTGQTTEVPWPSGDWDTYATTAGDGTAICVVENRNGSAHLAVGSTQSSELADVPLAEPGIVSDYYGCREPMFSGDGSRLYYTLCTPRMAGDGWAFDRASGGTTRLTHSPAPVAPADLAQPETTEIASFDGEKVPLFVFRPRSASAPPPVVIVIHGGPESQAVLSFNPIVQNLVGAGYAVIVPNVRGSTGYGKRYSALDDTTKRLDSVKDLASIHAFLSGAGFDDRRAALWGGSYGGYMVLAGLAFQPDLWAAGVDIVGLSDLVTFLENTSEYRRAMREREYGSLEHDREFLAAASPLRRANAISAPLFVIHGRNDPRVPVSETEQLVAAVRQRGLRCELLIYEDEGHGLARLANRLDAYPKAVAFLDQVLGVGASTP